MFNHQALFTDLHNKGFSKKKLAPLIGVSYVQLTRYAVGTNIPKADVYIKICQVAKLDPQEYVA